MARRTRYSEYKDRYANYNFELTDDGILFMQCHTNGGSLVWDWRAHDEMSRPRPRLCGGLVHVDLHIHVAPEMTVATAHDLTHAVESEIRRRFPNVDDVIIHTEPVGAPEP